MPRRASPEPRVLGWRTLAAAAGLLLLGYYVVPLLALVATQSPASFLDRIGDPAIADAVVTSLTTATATTALSLALGVPLAYWLAHTDFRGKRVLAAVLVLPLVLPPVVSGILLVTVFGPDGLGGLLHVQFVRTWVGVVLAQTFVASPFVVVTATVAFEEVDDRLREAAWTMGSSSLSTFRRVTLPLAWPGILAGATLTFARAMGEFGATLLVAYYPTTMPVQIWRSFVSSGLDSALPVAALLLAVSLVALLVLRALGVSRRRFGVWG